MKQSVSILEIEINSLKMFPTNQVFHIGKSVEYEVGEEGVVGAFWVEQWSWSRRHHQSALFALMHLWAISVYIWRKQTTFYVDGVGGVGGANDVSVGDTERGER